MMSRLSLSALLASFTTVSAKWVFSNSTTNPWQSTGSFDGGEWFDETISVLQVMQSQYWNGSYWPTSIQWENAVLDTLLSAVDRTLLDALIEYNGQITDSTTSKSTIKSDMTTYFQESESFYGSEDTIQIFGAAYDDAQWVVLEWLEVLKFINQNNAYSGSTLGQSDIAKFAHRAHIFYHIVQNEFDTSLCGGGLTWNPALAVYKNAVTNELFISSSIGMYLYFPGDNNTDPYPSPSYTAATGLTLPSLPTLAKHDPSLLQNAIEAFDWFQSQPFRNSQGLVQDGFHISSGQTTCDELSTSVYTYNQGIHLSGLRQLWEATGNTTYLDTGYDYIWSVMNATGWFATSSTAADEWSGLGQWGILADFCDPSDSCSQDARMFKGIYFHHLDLFCEPLPTKTALVPGLTYTASSSLAASHGSKCADYAKWVKHNAVAALGTEDSSGVIGEWWGASYANVSAGTEEAAEYAVTNSGADVMNNPAVLTQAPWKCDGRKCGTDAQHQDALASIQKLRRRGHGRPARRASDASDAHYVETQGSGLGVVMAAADMTLTRPAY